MTADEYKAAREQLGLGVIELAKKLGVTRRTATRYETGASAIPETSARLLLMYVKHGIPRGW